MAHTFTNLLTHVIFSTKDRVPHIDAELKPDLFAYMGGIVREIDGKALGINGTADHVHLLIKLPPTIAISDAMRVLKTNSSRWVHEQWDSRSAFGWQTGYGAFSVSQSNVPAVLRYIANQEEHHRKVSFQEEFLAYLKKHGIEYDERYIWE
jgi:REP element-mobilizing transposase RayT